MKKYSDEERVEIAKREYNYEKGNPVLIGKGVLPIGYAADFKDKVAGENPSIMELASVKKVTLLYRGSTSQMQILNNPVDFFADWIVNDKPMIKKIIRF